MRGDEVIETLKAHAPELRKLGVVRLSIFGSVARDEAAAGSDVDLAVTLTEGPNSGLGYLARLDHLKERFTTILGNDVDLIVEPTSRPLLQKAIDQDRQLIF